ncbi:MAG: hypothetical protein VX980_02915 [Actinomycetota bacterium]|nr:hypothetical protein [Actinomycetota bacterium]
MTGNPNGQGSCPVASQAVAPIEHAVELLAIMADEGGAAPPVHAVLVP